MGRFTVVGGDKRNIALAEMLFRQGHDVKLFGFVNNERELPMQCKLLSEAISKAQYIIGPTPCSLGGGALNAPFHNGPLYVEDLFRLIKPHQVFIAGYVKPEVSKLAEEYGIHIIDMLKREELLVLNAIPTAEGAIKIAIEETDITLHGSQIMVIGYGRVGTALCRMLGGIGAKVTVVVNTGQGLAQAKSAGYEAVFFKEMENYLPKADVIFNTVPEILLNEKNLPLVRESTLIIDLASPPGGVDASVSRALGLKALFTNSLPGKVAPITTASYILDTVNQIISELEGTNNG